MPTLTPCSAASFRLKNIRLPSIQRSIGLPKSLRIAAGTNDVVNAVATLNAAHVIALKDGL